MKIKTIIFIFVSLIIMGCNRMIGQYDFTKKYADEMVLLNKELIISEITEIQIKYRLPSDKEPSTAFTDNAYKNYLNGDDLAGVIKKYASATIDTLNPIKVELEKIVPVIKDKNYISDVTNSLKQSGNYDKTFDFYSVPFGSELSILYAVDSENNIKYINKDEFNKLNISESELRKQSIHNIRNILPKIEYTGSNGLYMITADGNYESSILLFDDIWTDIKTKIEGDIIIAIPSRDILLVTGSKNIKGLDIIKEKVDQVFNSGSYTLTKDLLIYQNGIWKKY